MTPKRPYARKKNNNAKFDDVRDWCVSEYCRTGVLPTYQAVSEKYQVCKRTALMHLKRIKIALSE